MRFTILSAALLLSVAGFSQENSTEMKPVSELKSSPSVNADPVKLNSSSTSNESEIHAKYVWKNGQVTQVTKESELLTLKSLLNSLNVKEAEVKSNPKTVNSPDVIKWLADAAIARAKFESKIAELEK